MISLKRFLPLKPLWYQYVKLSERDKQIYHRILKGVLCFEEAISMGGIALANQKSAVDVVSKIEAAIRADVPELFYWPHSNVTYGGSSGVTVKPHYICTADRAELTLQAMGSKVSCFLKTIRNYGDLQKVKRIHDFLVTNCTYDEQKRKAAYRIDGAILDGLPVCNGFALAFKYMCDRVEVPCLKVRGDYLMATDGNPGHAWNIVWVEGKPYHVDVTFDAGKTAGKQTIRYDYFLLSDAQIRMDRTQDPSIPVPPCRASYHFYDYLGCYFTRLENMAPKIAAHAKARKPLQFQLPPKWGGKPVCSDVVHDLIRVCLNRGNVTGINWMLWENRDHFVYYLEFDKK